MRILVARSTRAPSQKSFPRLDAIRVKLRTDNQCLYNNHKMFGLGGSPQISSQQKIQAAEAELDMVTGMFNSLVEQCHAKCINKSYAEGDVNKQEALCLDRCVSKYFETNVQVGENMQKLGQSGLFMGR